MKNLFSLGCLFCILLWVGCKHHEEHNHDTATDTSDNAYMVKILDDIYKNSDPKECYNLNLHMAALHKIQANQSSNSNEKSKYYFKYGIELLNGGEVEESITVFEYLVSQVRSQNIPISEPIKEIFEKLAIAYLRLGEQQNCVNNHTSSSCIIPLQPAGYHSLKSGSEKAIEIYTEILEKFPDDLSSRWLINIAYMTLGKYPADVPKKWLISIPPYNDKGVLPYFNDVAGKLGIDVLGLSGGANMEDFNNDGFLDIFVTGYGLNEQCKYFESDGIGGFEDKTQEAGLIGLFGGLNTIHADYNNDGFIDIFILRGGWLNNGGKIPNSLLQNNGNGTFTDVTKKAGLLTYHPTQTASWADYDGDGWLDLYIGNETTPNATETHPNEFYHNNGDGTFTEVAKQYGMNISAFCKGVNFGDINNDGRPDLYVSIMGGPNKLYVNRGGTTHKDWKFEEIAAKANVQNPNFSFPSILFDYNNDGLLDILVFGYSSSLLLNLAEDAAYEYLKMGSKGEKPRLYKNLGNESFEDVTPNSGFYTAIYAMGCSVGDVDNDGFQDIYAGTGAPDLRTIVPNRFFRNVGGKVFSDQTSCGFGHIQKGHGIAMGDLDNDGDEDIYCVQGGAFEGDLAYNILYQNPIENTNWINITLQGVASNKSAIGAKIDLTTTDKQGAQKHIYRWVGAGGSFGSSSLQLEIGLGDVVSIDEVTVHWPVNNNSTQVFKNLPLHSSIKIIEGKEGFEVLKKKVITFQDKGHSTHHH